MAYDYGDTLLISQSLGFRPGFCRTIDRPVFTSISSSHSGAPMVRPEPSDRRRAHRQCPRQIPISGTRQNPLPAPEPWQCWPRDRPCRPTAPVYLTSANPQAARPDARVRGKALHNGHRVGECGEQSFEGRKSGCPRATCSASVPTFIRANWRHAETATGSARI